MLLSEYTLIPDIFDINSYGNETSDENYKREICRIYLREVIKVLSEEAITRDFCNGELIKAIKEMKNRHPDTKFLLKRLAKRLRTFPAFSQIPLSAEKWCQEAINSHSREPLSGIITTKKTKNSFNNEIVGAIENLEKTSWWKNRSSSIRLVKTTTEYIQNLQPIFNHSKSLMFIDPYLDPCSSSHREFIDLLKAIPNKNPQPKIEIHVSCSKISKQDYQKNFTKLRKSLQQNLPEIECFIWNDFHDRYLISDLIGVSLPHGFGIGRSKTTWTRIGQRDKDDIQKEFDPAAQQHKLILNFTF